MEANISMEIGILVIRTNPDSLCRNQSHIKRVLFGFWIQTSRCELNILHEDSLFANLGNRGNNSLVIGGARVIRDGINSHPLKRDLISLKPMPLV